MSKRFLNSSSCMHSSATLRHNVYFSSKVSLQHTGFVSAISCSMIAQAPSRTLTPSQAAPQSRKGISTYSRSVSSSSLSVSVMSSPSDADGGHDLSSTVASAVAMLRISHVTLSITVCSSTVPKSQLHSQKAGLVPICAACSSQRDFKRC